VSQRCSRLLCKYGVLFRVTGTSVLAINATKISALRKVREAKQRRTLLAIAPGFLAAVGVLLF
jgi:hypothetical protein